MAFEKHKQQPQDGGANIQRPASGEEKADGRKEKRRRVRWKAFPGPRGIDEPLRLCFSREAYAELIAHAKQFLEVEVCGVLVGEFSEDDEGLYTFVSSTIVGAAANEKCDHVTFTQETWTHIHEVLEREHPKCEIVGWYHTHPGFGVEFSDMDLFVQQNFFSRTNQVAFVSDPLGGEEAACVNSPGGIRYLSRFWVDGHERRCSRSKLAARIGGAVAAGDRSGPEDQSSIEDRIIQLTRAVDEQRIAMYRFLLVIGMVAGVGIVLAIGSHIYFQWSRDYRQPETVNFADIPVRVGDELYYVGVQAVRWRAPQKMNNLLVESIRADLLAEEEIKRQKEAQRAMEKGSGADALPSTTSSSEGGASESPLDSNTIEADNTE